MDEVFGLGIFQNRFTKLSGRAMTGCEHVVYNLFAEDIGLWDKKRGRGSRSIKGANTSACLTFCISSAWLVVALYDSKGAAFLCCRYYGLLLYQWKDNFS